jgi:hypothetical protein
MHRPEPLYEADVRGIVRDIMQGETENAIKRLKKWPKEAWSDEKATTTLEDMLGDVLAFAASVLPSQRQILAGMKKWKGYGKTNYPYASGNPLIDEAIAEQLLVIERLEKAPLLLLELED